MLDRTSRPLASCRITRVEPGALGTTIPWPPVGRFSSTPEYAATSRKMADIPKDNTTSPDLFVALFGGTRMGPTASYTRVLENSKLMWTNQVFYAAFFSAK